MNAYELADCLESLCKESKGSFTKDAYIMLRQQADRIAELEKLVHQRFDDGKRLGVLETEDKFRTTSQIKELSDEEISLVIWESYQSIGNATLTDLCKAILKKASEK